MEAVTCTLENAASAIGVSKPTVYKLIKAGQIETVRIAGRHLVIVESVRNMVASARQKVAA